MARVAAWWCLGQVPVEQLEVRTDRRSWGRSRRSRSCSCHSVWDSHVRGAGLESIKMNHQALPSRLRVLHPIHSILELADDAKRTSPRTI